MSLQDHRGSVYAFRRLMDTVAEEITQGGEIKPARPIYTAADPHKVTLINPRAYLKRWWTGKRA